MAWVSNWHNIFTTMILLILTSFIGTTLSVVFLWMFYGDRVAARLARSHINSIHRQIESQLAKEEAAIKRSNI